MTPQLPTSVYPGERPLTYNELVPGQSAAHANGSRLLAKELGLRCGRPGVSGTKRVPGS